MAIADAASAGHPLVSPTKLAWGRCRNEKCRWPAAERSGQRERFPAGANKETIHVPNPDRIFDARREHCIDGSAARKSPVSRSRSACARLIKGDVNAATRYTAHGGGLEADHARSRRGYFPQIRAGFPIPRQKIASHSNCGCRSRRPAKSGGSRATFTN
jgi:hypothetical protein